MLDPAAYTPDLGSLAPAIKASPCPNRPRRGVVLQGRPKLNRSTSVRCFVLMSIYCTGDTGSGFVKIEAVRRELGEASDLRSRSVEGGCSRNGRSRFLPASCVLEPRQGLLDSHFCISLHTASHADLNPLHNWYGSRSSRCPDAGERYCSGRC